MITPDNLEHIQQAANTQLNITVLPFKATRTAHQILTTPQPLSKGKKPTIITINTENTTPKSFVKIIRSNGAHSHMAISTASI